jgi:hypothetical protein
MKKEKLRVSVEKGRKRKRLESRAVMHIAGVG